MSAFRSDLTQGFNNSTQSKLLPHTKFLFSNLFRYVFQHGNQFILKVHYYAKLIYLFILGMSPLRGCPDQTHIESHQQDKNACQDYIVSRGICMIGLIRFQLAIPI